MHILVAFDKFKDSMTAAEACLTAQEALSRAHPNWTVTTAPLTDGGEGFCEILTKALYGTFEDVPVFGPQLVPQTGRVGFVDVSNVPDPVRSMLKLPGWGQIAIIEMAEASGLQAVSVSERTPWKTSSYGTGQLIAHAADSGAAAIILGVGGSATIDLGLGALEAIGLELVDEAGATLCKATPQDWPRVTRIRGEVWPHIPPIYIACDVRNPLLGPNGAVRIFGKQKGLIPDQMPDYERLLGGFAKKLCDATNSERTLMAEPGTGAAGGISFGLRAACDATIVPGYGLVEAWLDLKKKIAEADLVVTGEGKFDESSMHGKGPGSILLEAARQHKPSKIMAGLVQNGLKLPEKTTVDVIAPIGYTKERSIAEGKKLLARKVVEVFLR